MQRIWKKNDGVSPVIATILMVAITVVLAAVLYVMVSGYMTGGGGSPVSGSLSYRTADSTPTTGKVKFELSLSAPANPALTDVSATILNGSTSSTKTAFATGSNSITGSIGAMTYWLNVTHLVSDTTHLKGGDRMSLEVSDATPAINNWQVVVSIAGYSGTVTGIVPS